MEREGGEKGRETKRNWGAAIGAFALLGGIPVLAAASFIFAGYEEVQILRKK
jgi:hypothetical protein